jgi:hypothetical protein
MMYLHKDSDTNPGRFTSTIPIKDVLAPRFVVVGDEVVSLSLKLDDPASSLGVSLFEGEPLKGLAVTGEVRGEHEYFESVFHV